MIISVMQVTASTSLGAKMVSPAISPVPTTPLKGNTIKIVKGKLGGIEQPESSENNSAETAPKVEEKLEKPKDVLEMLAQIE